jgi:hypothetical protein
MKITLAVSESIPFIIDKGEAPLEFNLARALFLKQDIGPILMPIRDKKFVSTCFSSPRNCCIYFIGHDLSKPGKFSMGWFVSSQRVTPDTPSIPAAIKIFMFLLPIKFMLGYPRCLTE